MIDRYSTPEMTVLWSEETKLAEWKRVEEAVLAAMEDLSLVPAGTTQQLEQGHLPTPAQVWERELVTRHDFAAFVDLLSQSMTEGGEWVHFGLTSSDVLDTAQSLRLKAVCDVLNLKLARLIRLLIESSLSHFDTLMLGRTHGMAAEPTTWGIKLASHILEMDRNLERLDQAKRMVSVGKISGAVGTYAHLFPEVEQQVCERLGLTPEPVSSQVTGRDRPAQLLWVIAVIGAGLARLATEIRLLQRPEVGELAEGFSERQKGSSAMPHKRNPIRSERLVGLSRLLRSYVGPSLENVGLWHERDMTHSSVERIVLADASTLLHYMLEEMCEIVENLKVFPEKMRSNLEKAEPVIYSQGLMLELISSHSLSRDEAYRLTQGFFAQLPDGESSFPIWAETYHQTQLDPPLADEIFNPWHYVRHRQVIAARIEALSAQFQPVQDAKMGGDGPENRQ